MATEALKRREVQLQLRAAFAPASFNAETRSVELVWSTGADVARSGWGESYIERLSLDPDAVRLDRLNAGAPLLNAHGSYALSDVIGVVERAWLAGNQGHAVVRFSDRPEIEPIVQDVKSGILRNISVGYKVHRWEITPPSDSTGVEIRTAVDWEPYELSLVPIPADAGAQIRSENITQEAKMNSQTITNESVDNLDSQTRAERQRTAGILDAARKLHVSDDLAHKLIADGVSLDEARMQLIDARATEERKTPAVSRVEVHPSYAQRGADALMQKLAPCFKGTSSRAAVRVLEDHLIETGAISRHDALSPKEIVARAFSTSDFPVALQGLGAREVLSAYRAAQNGLIAASTRKQLNDFRPKSGLRFSQLGALPGKKEGGEYKATGFSEEAAYELTAKEYGTVINITRKAFINDDVDMAGRLLIEAGRAGAETDRDLLATALGSISWTAKNSVSSPMGIEALGAGVLLLRRQIDAEKRPVSFEPDLVVAAPEHELELRQLMGDYQPATAGDVQPFGNLRLEIDHRLAAGAFFMIDSRYRPLMIGSIGDPAVSTEEDFKTGNLMIRVQHDAAACVVDTRSICKVNLTTA